MKASGRSENTAPRNGECGASCIWRWTRQPTISWQQKCHWRMSMMPRCCQPYSIHCGVSWAGFMRMAPTDSKASHQLISYKGATACIPPRKNAGLWEKGHPRNEAVQVMRKEGLAHWKKISGYHRRSLAETAMYRFKQLLAGKISLRTYNGQVGEVMAYVGAINKLNSLGLPVRQP